MKLARDVIEELVVPPGTPASLDRRSTTRTEADWLGPLGRSSPKQLATQDLAGFKAALETAQELLFANGTWSLLLVLQGPDAAGKDGTIKHVMSGVNPQGCTVVAFKEPSAEELRHDFLWRCVKVLPERGQIGIFNRSYYEEVVVCRVHPELLAAERLPTRPDQDGRFWQARYEAINAFERHLVDSGTRIVKVYLHLSEDEQRRRLLARLDDPAKQWKLSMSDLTERAHFGTFQQAYEDALTATSTPWAPWHVVPADHKRALRALVGGILVDAVDRLDLRPPSIDEERARLLEAARAMLAAEP